MARPNAQPPLTEAEALELVAPRWQGFTLTSGDTGRDKWIRATPTSEVLTAYGLAPFYEATAPTWRAAARQMLRQAFDSFVGDLQTVADATLTPQVLQNLRPRRRHRRNAGEMSQVRLREHAFAVMAEAIRLVQQPDQVPEGGGGGRR